MAVTQTFYLTLRTNKKLQMKTNKYLLFPMILLLTSCYIYKPYTEKDVEETVNNNNSQVVPKSIREESKGFNQRQDQTMSPAQIEMMEKKEKEIENQKNQEKMNSSSSKPGGESDKSKRGSMNNIKNEESKPKEAGIKGKLQPNKYYKITALDHQYKIQVDKWEGDTLISHKIRKPSKQYKFHINDIQEDAILERRFSKPFSDLFTVGAYASGAAIVLLLIL